MNSQTAIILVAAGNSSRLGRPKQLLEVKGQKLLEYVALQACHSQATDVFVVLGSEKDTLRALLDKLDIHLVDNEHWEKGMGSSIKKGMQAVIAKGNYDSVIVSVCDQPYLTSQLFNQLINQPKEHKIITSAYNNQDFGPPTLFRKSIFENLLHIDDLSGARSLIIKHQKTLGLVAFPQGEIDLDTEADYENYKVSHN